MGSGEPSNSVKRRIANLYRGKNRYATLDDESVASEENDGGGAPLHSPAEKEVFERGGGAPLYSPVEEKLEKGGGATLDSHDEDCSDTTSETASSSNGTVTNSVEETTAPSAVAVNGDARSGTKESGAQAEDKPYITTNSAGLNGPNANMQASGPGNTYPGGPTNRISVNFGMGNPARSQPVINRMPHYSHGYNRLAHGPINGYGGMNMYPQYGPNRGFPQYASPTQQLANYATPPYQQTTGHAYAYNHVNSSPTPSTVIHPDMTPKAAATPMSQYGTPVKSGSHVQSEPRNFAPRPHGPTYQQGPPPQFMIPGNAAAVVNGTVPQAKKDDPFIALSPPHKEHAVRTLLPPVKEADESGYTGTAIAISPVAVAPEIRLLRSSHLNQLTADPYGLPTAEEALNPANFPFIESCSQSQPVQTGVVHLENIPFATKTCEIIALFGRNARIVSDVYEPVHIMMERTTSKTQDAYVEFVTVDDAIKAVDRIHHSIRRGRLPRLGDRPVNVTLTSMSRLMADLFPLAKGVMWVNSTPEIQSSVDGQPWKDFKGFWTEEEMTMLVKHVEIPQRSPYSKECPQRPFESLISVIKKAPWHMTDQITIRQRWAVYYSTHRLLELLILKMKKHRERELAPGEIYQDLPHLNEQLQKRLVRAAMLCPGFSVLQKDNIAFLVNMPDAQERGFNQPRHSDLWLHQQTICPKPGIPLDVLEWYIAIIREETERFVNSMPVTERTKVEATHAKIKSHYFGYLWHEIGFPSGQAFDELTLRQAADMELDAIERVLKRALPATKH